jgi:hypothetical protein
MGELADYGITKDVLQQMYDEWVGGAKKSDLERRYLQKPESHGKLFSTLVRQHLGIETERRSHMTDERNELRGEVRRLRSILLAHGIDPDMVARGHSEVDSAVTDQDWTDQTMRGTL